jgi:hypothetical protein
MFNRFSLKSFKGKRKFISADQNHFDYGHKGPLQRCNQAWTSADFCCQAIVNSMYPAVLEFMLIE